MTGSCLHIGIRLHPKGTQDRLAPASLDRSVIVSPRVCHLSCLFQSEYMVLYFSLMTEVDWCFSQNFRHLSSYGIVIAKLCVSYLGNYYRLRSVLGSKFFVSDVWYPNRGTWRGIKSLPPCSNFPQLVSPLHIYYTTLALIAKPSTIYISLIKTLIKNGPNQAFYCIRYRCCCHCTSRFSAHW